MRQVTITIPDEYYENLMQFLKPIPNTLIDNSKENYDQTIEKIVQDRIINSKPDDYVDARISLNRLKEKHGF